MYFASLCLLSFPPHHVQPNPVTIFQDYIIYNNFSTSEVSVGCQNIFNDADGVGTQQALAVLIRSSAAVTASSYAPLMLAMLLKRTPNTFRTTIADMYIALYSDDNSVQHNPGPMVGRRFS